MAGKRGSTHYRIEVKRQAVELFLEGHLTYRAIAEQLGIRDPDRIEVWVRMYRREGELAFHKPKGRPRKVEDQAAYIARLEMENDLLKKYHAELRKLTTEKRDTE